MEIFEFDKCLLTRLEESMDVLRYKDEAIASSKVRGEWSYYIEIQIEPTGWQALWHIPRVICEELNLRYPTVVSGMVEQVLFKELKAIFIVQAVQDDDVHIPERQEVDLEDLFPTKEQENTELNIEKTADCLDRLRFFYTHVWMPWDNDIDDDMDWVEKHLESRIRFCYDLKRKDMKRSLAAHVRTLLAEARYLQKRREFLEMDLSDDEDLSDDVTDKSQITNLMRLHLRLAKIRSEIELLENPEMRKIYEKEAFDDDRRLKNGLPATGTGLPTAHIVLRKFPIAEIMQYVAAVQNMIGEDMPTQICRSLEDALNNCNSSDNLYLSPGRHTIKFLEYLNDDGSICGVPLTGFPDQPSDVVISSKDDDSILLIFDGNFTLKNITLDGRNIRTGILLKNGTLCLKNCRILGDGKSSTQQGIVCNGNSQIILEDCVLQDFATGVILNNETEMILVNSVIRQCGIAIECSDLNKVQFEKAVISDSKCSGIYLQTSLLKKTVEQRRIELRDIRDLEEYYIDELPWSGDCIFENSNKSNIVIFNEKARKFPKTLQCRIRSESDPEDEFKVPAVKGEETSVLSASFVTDSSETDHEIVSVDDDSVIEID